MIEIIKTTEGYMVQHMDGDNEGDYLCDAKGDNTFDSYAEAEAVFYGMPKTNRYKVIAKMTTYLYVHVDADSKDDAIAIAKDMDGGDFIPLNQGIVAEGDWEIIDAQLEVNK